LLNHDRSFRGDDLTMRRRLGVALAFLTRLPVPARWIEGARAEDVGRAAPLFPVAGAVVGALLALVVLALATRVTPLVNGAIAAALSALWTGGLHLDGLADMADGFGGGRTRDDVLAIMRDHRIGAYGAVALILAIVLEVALIAALVEADAARAARALVVAGTLSRASLVPLAAALPYARADGGLGAALVGQLGAGSVAVAIALGAGAALALGGWWGALACAVAAALTLHDGFFVKRRIGGYTGDTLGAHVVVVELGVLLAAAVVS
jgi:cobalamin 5'-phosphate synthase/cobalamin synthase